MNKFFKDLLLSTSIGLLILLFFAVLTRLNGNPVDLEWMLNGLLITASYAYPLYYISAYAFDYAEKAGEKLKLNKWRSALAGFPLVIILNVAAIVLIQYVLAEYIFEERTTIFGETTWERVKVPLWISMTVGIGFYIYHFIAARQKSKLKEQTEKVTLVTQSHEALKSQIGPHFLFNSLNVLSGLIDENPFKAQEFIAGLAQVYRYVLDQKDKDWVKVSEEISFAENYLDLVKTRFENGLNIEIEEGLRDSEALIAPLTLQLLLENSIKHNSVSAHKPLHIRIFSQNNYLVTANNLNPKKTLGERTGTGLKNIKGRYHEAGENIYIEQTENQFVVKIPLLNQNLIKMNQQYQFTEEELKSAREEVRDRWGFFGNLAAYIIVCSVFVIINLWTGGYFWAIWPIIGWGTGVFFHGMGVFVFGKKAGRAGSWEEEQARKLLEKRQKRMNEFSNQ